MLAPPWMVGAPSYRESWICPCDVNCQFHDIRMCGFDLKFHGFQHKIFTSSNGCFNGHLYGGVQGVSKGWGVCLGVCVKGGMCLGVSRDLCVQRRCVSRGCTPPGPRGGRHPGPRGGRHPGPRGRHPGPRGRHPRPPVDRMTDTCKNITLPQTSFAGGKYRDSFSFLTLFKHQLMLICLHSNNIKLFQVRTNYTEIT